jgi:hypothetical protein
MIYATNFLNILIIHREDQAMHQEYINLCVLIFFIKDDLKDY